VSHKCEPREPPGSTIPYRASIESPYKNSRNYNVPYQRSHTAELDVYRDRGGPRMTKYLRAIHNKFHRIIDDYVGVMVENPGGIKTPKVPDPRKYSGEIDTEVFDR
jgi:hypothetical protein